MRREYKLFAIISLIYICMCILINLIIINLYDDNSSREYRVEINRLTNQILDIEDKIKRDNSGNKEINQYIDGIKLKDNYDYIIRITSYNTNDFLNDFDNNISGINNDYYIYNSQINTYIIEYSNHLKQSSYQIIVVNAALVVIFCFMLIVFMLIIKKVFTPFRKISNLPYELTKGNFVMPLYETKSKMFGKFIWGLDVLRDNIEEQKKNELILQKEKKTLLLSLSHDIKTPLSAIKLYAKALSKDLYNTQQKKEQVINNIGDKVIEIEGYLTDIIKATNEDFLRFKVSNSEFYIKDILMDIKNYYEDKLELNNIKFCIDTNKNSLLYGDNERAEEVIQNVMENAIKYGDGNKIWLETINKSDSFIVVVGNTGCQLDVNELPHIFDSFWRGSNISKNPGSGLGLYICRQLMQLMDGEIVSKIDENKNMLIYITFRKC